MLDINLVRDHPEKVRENLKKKHKDKLLPLVDDTLALDKEWKTLKSQNDDSRAERNKISQDINTLKKEGKDASKQIKKAADIPGEIKCREEKMNELQDKIRANLLTLPNIIDPSVKVGKDESENVVVKKWGTPKKPDFELISHGELAEQLGIADFERSTKIAGAGFFYLKGDLALLNQALIRFATEHMVKKGYTYVEPPLMMRHKAYEGVIQLEDFEEVIYKVENDDLFLIATSEHPLMAMYMDEAIPEDQLPIKMTAYSMCFRKEIGSHGVDTRGLFRTHQFNKVEQVVICKPEESKKFYDEMLKNSEEFFQALELPYHVLDLCSGDLSAVKAKSCDIEAWMPRQEKYREVCSLSNCTDYQTRRLNTKVADKQGNKYYPHSLNNTVVATSRAMVAILENYQNKDGSVTVPKVLVPYMMGKKKIEGHKTATKGTSAPRDPQESPSPKKTAKKK
ncbi:MAG TPA: serine--tRNA ligase [Candidatus Nanoarchaeia archaeon]|nr:serine--tRNA ligase [Candidatus Nanoarchaeia archaeon]